MLGIAFVTKQASFYKALILIKNFTTGQSLADVGRSRIICFINLLTIQYIVNFSVLTQTVSRLNLSKIGHLQVNILITFITFNRRISMMVIICNITTSNQELGWFLASFFRTMNVIKQEVKYVQNVSIKCFRSSRGMKLIFMYKV